MGEGFQLQANTQASLRLVCAEFEWRPIRLCLANGTIALLGCSPGVGHQFGDEVILPAYTWDGTAIAVLQAGGSSHLQISIPTPTAWIQKLSAQF